MKKLYCFLVVIGFACFSCSAQNESESLENVIMKVVKAYKERDEATLNSLISKEKGLVTLYRRGMMDTYQTGYRFDFKNPVPEYWPYDDISIGFKVQFDGLPVYSCETEKWDKIGLYCDTTYSGLLLAWIAKNLNEFLDQGIPEEEIREYEKLEKNSYRVVLVDNEQRDFVFYLTFINKQWFLTILDRVSSDCSA